MNDDKILKGRKIIIGSTENYKVYKYNTYKLYQITIYNNIIWFKL